MEKMFPFDDAHLEARRGRLKVPSPKDLICESNNQIAKMCIDPKCVSISLFCDKKHCPSCPKEEHKKCKQIFLEGVAESINHHLPVKKYILEKMGGIENKFFQSLRENNNRLGEEIRLAGLKKKSKDMIQEIFDRKNPKCLRGIEAS